MEIQSRLNDRDSYRFWPDQEKGLVEIDIAILCVNRMLTKQPRSVCPLTNILPQRHQQFLCSVNILRWWRVKKNSSIRFIIIES